jgi:hypothetical protein
LCLNGLVRHEGFYRGDLVGREAQAEFGAAPDHIGGVSGVASLSELDAVFTDQPLPEGLTRACEGWGTQVAVAGLSGHRSQAKVKLPESGSSRARVPVRAKSALARAGAAGGVPGSPMPRILLPVSRMRTRISGHWCRRRGS